MAYRDQYAFVPTPVAVKITSVDATAKNHADAVAVGPAGPLSANDVGKIAPVGGICCAIRYRSPERNGDDGCDVQVHGRGFCEEFGSGHFRTITLPPMEVLEEAYDNIERFITRHC